MPFKETDDKIDPELKEKLDRLDNRASFFMSIGRADLAAEILFEKERILRDADFRTSLVDLKANTGPGRASRYYRPAMDVMKEGDPYP